MTFSSETITILLTAALLVALVVIVWWKAVGFALLAATFAMAFFALLADYDGIAVVMALVSALLRVGSLRRKRR